MGTTATGTEAPRNRVSERPPVMKVPAAVAPGEDDAAKLAELQQDNRLAGNRLATTGAKYPKNRLEAIGNATNAAAVQEQLREMGLNGPYSGQLINDLVTAKTPEEVSMVLDTVPGFAESAAKAATAQASVSRLAPDNFFHGLEVNVSPLRTAEEQRALDESFAQATTLDQAVVQFKQDGVASAVKLERGAQLLVPTLTATYGGAKADAGSTLSIERLGGANGYYCVSIFSSYAGGVPTAEKVFVPAHLANEVSLLYQSPDGKTSTATIAQFAKAGKADDIAAANAYESRQIPSLALTERFRAFSTFAEQNQTSQQELMLGLRKSLVTHPLEQVMLGAGKLPGAESTVTISQSPIVDSTKFRGSKEIAFGKFSKAHMAVLEQGLSGPLSNALKAKLEAAAKGVNTVIVTLKETENMVAVPTMKVEHPITITITDVTNNSQTYNIAAGTLLTMADATMLQQIANNDIEAGGPTISVSMKPIKALKPMNTYVIRNEDPLHAENTGWSMFHTVTADHAQVIAAGAAKSAVFSETVTASEPKSSAKTENTSTASTNTTSQNFNINMSLAPVSDSSFGEAALDHSLKPASKKLTAVEVGEFLKALPKGAVAANTAVASPPEIAIVEKPPAAEKSWWSFGA